MGLKRLIAGFEFLQKKNINVNVQDNSIVIGAGYLNCVATIVRLSDGLFSSHDTQYLSQDFAGKLNRDRKLLTDLIDTPDIFDRELVVWGIEDHEVVAFSCEEYGYPNTTFSGKLMFENMFFENREDAVLNLREELDSFIHYQSQRARELRQEAEEIEKSVSIARLASIKYSLQK